MPSGLDSIKKIQCSYLLCMKWNTTDSERRSAYTGELKEIYLEFVRIYLYFGIQSDRDERWTGTGLDTRLE